ncbi:hypothetical protein L1987_19549 [Smallanthus sonchifolius]|uniref:Uncharacterized protein n=1 Tax=Smallanthus sonchifolius TaxID=185202 RepID=A0ACB9IRG1_9ASTR|nr:hypothetical protein L1987_19549 [Smallanthus sonchifolius]
MNQEGSQMNNEPQMKEITEKDWNQILKKGEIKKEYMDLLIMDFLAINNLPTVSEAFHQESGCPLNIQDFCHTKSQKIVKHYINDHQSDKAINLLNNNLGLSFLKHRRQLHFRLETQKMVDLRNRGDFKGAYAFTPEFLMWADYDEFRNECYETISQLFSGDVNANMPNHLTYVMRIYCLAMDTVEELISVQDCLIDRAVETLRLVEYELNKIVKFPNFNIDSGYPQPLPFFQGTQQCSKNVIG